MHTLTTAAHFVGVTRSTIYRAIKAGRLPACKLDNGAYAIYSGALLRAFPVTSSFTKAVCVAERKGFSFPVWDVS
jgi:excisionase family DNA binding protein